MGKECQRALPHTRTALWKRYDGQSGSQEPLEQRPSEVESTRIRYTCISTPQHTSHSFSLTAHSHKQRHTDDVRERVHIYQPWTGELTVANWIFQGYNVVCCSRPKGRYGYATTYLNPPRNNTPPLLCVVPSSHLGVFCPTTHPLRGPVPNTSCAFFLGSPPPPLFTLFSLTLSLSLQCLFIYTPVVCVVTR